MSQFTDHVVYLVKNSWNEDADGLKKWKAIKDGLLEASNTMLGDISLIGLLNQRTF